MQRVIICVPSQMRPSNTRRYALNGIEAVCTTVCLPDANLMRIALLYRSPSVSMATLITVVSRLLTYVSVSIAPCVILGNFNENLLHQHHSSLHTVMSNHGFTQLVQSPTTAQGTLIDHVYYNNPSSNDIVQIQDTYYRDHDTVYCSMHLSS